MTQTTSTGRHFQAGIDELKRELALQGTTVSARLSKAVRGLATRDLHALDEVAIGDGDINARQMDIDDRAFKLLALQQPVAIDLRVIVAAIKVNADLERIGDLAVNVAEASRRYIDFGTIERRGSAPAHGRGRRDDAALGHRCLRHRQRRPGPDRAGAGRHPRHPARPGLPAARGHDGQASRPASRPRSS